MQKHMRWLFLLVGLVVGCAATLIWSNQRNAPQPIPHLHSELAEQIEAINESMERMNPRGLYKPYSISPISDSISFVLVEGELGEDGLSKFTGRIIGWNTDPAPPKHHKDMPGDGPWLSLYFDNGELYCVDRMGVGVRYMIEQGQVRHVVSMEWGNIGDKPSPQASIEDKRAAMWRLDKDGYVTHKSRLSHDPSKKPDEAWDAESVLWEPTGGRYDTFLSQGQRVVDVTTAADGSLRQLVFHYQGDERRQRVLVFDPEGRIAGDYDNPAP